MAEKRSYTRWTLESLKEAAKPYKTPGEFFENNPAAYMAARRKKVFDEVTAHMDTVRFLWTEKMLLAEAQKYKTRSEFAKGSRAAYSAAARQGLLDSVCTHMPRYAGKGKKRGPNKRTKKQVEQKKDDLGSMMGL